MMKLAYCGLLCFVLSFARAENKITDSVDPDYGSKLRQIRNDAGHEHNLYYYRDPWNADGSRMIGIQSDMNQKNWRVCLYDGDGAFIKELYPITRYDWRICWDRRDPKILYTMQGATLYRFNVESGQAEALKTFKPNLMLNGPSLNEAGDRILVTTVDKAFHSYHLPDMTDERTFKPAVPEGCTFHWDKPRYMGCKNLIDTAYSGGQKQAIVVYDDDGKVVQTFDGIGGGGHYDWSKDGKLAYFKLAGGGRGTPRTPFEIHVVNLDGSEDKLLFSVPGEKAGFHNLHLSWPRGVGDWFIASFFPSGGVAEPPLGARTSSPAAANASGKAKAGENGRNSTSARGNGRTARPARQAAPPQSGVEPPLSKAANEPPYDEIMLVRLDGTTKYLAHTGTIYTRAAGRGQEGDMFWAQPLGRPSADGSRICFNSSKSGTVDLNILYVGK